MNKILALRQTGNPFAVIAAVAAFGSRLAAAGLFLVCICGWAQAQKVDVDYDRGVNFSRMKTFAWNPDNPALPTLESVNANRLDSAIRYSAESYLKSRGFFQVSNRSNFVLGYSVLGSREQDAPRAAPQTAGAGAENWRPFSGASNEEASRGGTIVISVLDPESMRVIWQARASDVIKDSKKVEKDIENAVKKMLSKFPPK